MSLARVLSFSILAFSFSLPFLHAASTVGTTLSGARAYPNPWRADKHASSSIKFDNMPASSTVKVFTIAAEEVTSLSADSTGMAMWDRTNRDGQSVASGVYIYLIIDPQGNTSTGKLAIIK